MPNYDGGHYFLTMLAPVRLGTTQGTNRFSWRQTLLDTLAMLPNSQVGATTRDDEASSPFTRNTIVDPGALRRELAAIRARGYSIDNCEHEPDLRCVGAPIRNAAGRVFAAISASGPARRLPDERIPGLAEQVVAHAEAISARLGHVPEKAEAP